jgi:hypothetical protein
MDRLTRLLLVAAALLAFSSAPPAARAGEIVSNGPSCEPTATAARPCAWKASHCKRPDTPMLYVANAAEYNRATAMLNTYAEGLNAYMTCVANEARADMNSAADMIKASVEKTQAGLTADFNRSKAQLDAARLKVQLQ